MNKLVKRLIFWPIFALFCAGVAHVAASYICVIVTVHRIEAKMTANPSVMIHVAESFKSRAPLHNFQLLRGWANTNHDTRGGIIFLWASYVVPFLVVFGLLIISPK